MVNDYITRTKNKYKKKKNQHGDCEVTKNNWSSSQADTIVCPMYSASVAFLRVRRINIRRDKIKKIKNKKVVNLKLTNTAKIIET